MTEDYEYNVELWSHSHPKEAIWLQYLECEHVESFKSQAGFLNLRKKEDKTPYYQTENPLEEAEVWASSLDLSECEVCYIYGVGLGAYYLPLKVWLKNNPDRHIVFLEDDLEVIAKLFETENGTTLLKDPQVSLYYFKGLSEADSIFNQIFWHFPMAKIQITALGYYEKEKAKIYAELKYKITYDAAVKSSLLEEYLQFGIAFYRNYYLNLLKINESYLGNALFGELKSIPAIICGAGPSLKKNIKLLKKFSNKAAIFAGSSALNALAKEGVKPHLGAGIDPNKMQEERLKNIQDLDFPFLYRNRVYPGALRNVQGPKLYVTGSGGYEIAGLFEDKFDISGKVIEEGRNVVNFCLEAAFEMGCNPIIFVGMDLAFTEMKAYAEGVVEDPAVQFDEKVKSETDLCQSLVCKEDIYGNEIHTLWKWVSEAKWIGDFAELHPEVVLINATEGGLGFPGIPNMALAEVEKSYLTKDYEIASKIEAVYKAHPLSRISKEEVISWMEELKAGLERCLEALKMLDTENGKVLIEMAQTGDLELALSGVAIMTEMELAEEPAFIYVLQIFNDVGSKLMQRDFMRLNNPANPAPKLAKELEKLRLNHEKYQFLSNVARVNIELINHALFEDAGG